MIKYIGSKRTLVPAILSVVRDRGTDVRTVIDLFSGTSRVGHAFKAAGYQVLANDHNAYAHALATCYVQTDLEGVQRDAQKLVAELNRLPGTPAWDVRSARSRKWGADPVSAEGDFWHSLPFRTPPVARRE